MELRFDPIDVMRFIDDDLLVHCANRQTEADGSGSAGSVPAMFSITSWGGNARELREKCNACRTGCDAVPQCFSEQIGPLRPSPSPSSPAGIRRQPRAAPTCSFTDEPPLVLLQLFRPNLVGHRAGPRNEHGKARIPGPHPLPRVPGVHSLVRRPGPGARPGISDRERPGVKPCR